MSPQPDWLLNSEYSVRQRVNSYTGKNNSTVREASSSKPKSNKKISLFDSNKRQKISSSKRSKLEETSQHSTMSSCEKYALSRRNSATFNLAQ
jgi:hypothetical protein